MGSNIIKCNRCHLNPGAELSPDCCGGLVFVNHSGGAKGADSAWDFYGRKYGITDHRHYWHNGLPKPPLGNVEITDEELEEGWEKVLLANKKLKRRPDIYKSLLARNWFQVKNADSVFAISTLVASNPANQIPDQVSGGTGWAVQMAIDAKKPVFIFDQDVNLWYRFFDYYFVNCNQPTLTQNYAGIGTRNINENGKNAIELLYKAL